MKFADGAESQLLAVTSLVAIDPENAKNAAAGPKARGGDDDQLILIM